MSSMIGLSPSGAASTRTLGISWTRQQPAALKEGLGSIRGPIARKLRSTLTCTCPERSGGQHRWTNHAQCRTSTPSEGLGYTA